LKKLGSFILVSAVISASMENSTNEKQYRWEYEYYYDYLDAVIVDESKLKYNKCKYLSFI
jgi:hypothetical protein